MKNQEPIVINLRKVHNGYCLDQDLTTHIVLKKNKNIRTKQVIEQHEDVSQYSAQHVNQKSIKSNQNDFEEIPEKQRELLSHKLIFKEELKNRGKVFIPTSSSWFDINKIHKIEREALPEFFQMSNTKNPQSYKNLRNSIIEIFYKYPNRYLTAINCLQLLGGDCCSIIRVHHFLEHWGLINFYFDIQNQNTQNCSVIAGNKNAKLDMFQHYEDYLNQEKNKKPLEFLHNLASQITPNCDYCGQQCKTTWFIERKKKGDKENDIDNVSYILCPYCYSKEKFPSIYIKKDFKKQTISEMLKQQDKKNKTTWTLDKSLKILQKFKELDCNIKSLSEELKLDIVEIITNILKIPFKYFQNFNRLSTRNFEIIFKKNSIKKPTFDDNQHNPIIEHVTFLRLLFDYNFTTQDEKQNESFALHDTLPQNNGQFLGNQKYPTNLLVQNLIRQNKDKIIKVKKDLKNQALYLKERSETKILEKLNAINEAKTQRIMTKLDFFYDYDKHLQFRTLLHQIAENDIIVNQYLKKKNLLNQFI